MCDTCPAPMSINATMCPPPRCSRKSSAASCGGGRRSAGYTRPTSASISRQVSRTGGMGQGLCCVGHPRPDCCLVPCCKPQLPKCPVGVFVERTQPIRPDRHYEPPNMPFEALSSYREQFHLKCAERAKSFKPLSVFDPSEARMDGLSSYREAYTCKPVLPYTKPPWGRANQFEPSDAKMDGASTYRVDYQGCRSERVLSVKPLSTFDPSTAKMEGLTTYRSNYIPYCPREYDYAKQPQIGKQLNPSFSCAPMEGISTYRGDYWPKCCTKRQSMKPTNKTRFSDSKFADRTTYRNDFNPFHFEKCVGQCIPPDAYNCMNTEMYCCQPDEKGDARDEDPCPPMPGCCPGGPIRYPGSCGNEMGLRPGQPLPECCRLDTPPKEAEEICLT